MIDELLPRLRGIIDIGIHANELALAHRITGGHPHTALVVLPNTPDATGVISGQCAVLDILECSGFQILDDCILFLLKHDSGELSSSLRKAFRAKSVFPGAYCIRRQRNDISTFTAPNILRGPVDHLSRGLYRRKSASFLAGVILKGVGQTAAGPGITPTQALAVDLPLVSAGTAANPILRSFRLTDHRPQAEAATRQVLPLLCASTGDGVAGS